MITNPQDYIDKFYQQVAKEKLKRKPTDKWKKKIYTNFNYGGKNEDSRRTGTK